MGPTRLCRIGLPIAHPSSGAAQGHARTRKLPKSSFSCSVDNSSHSKLLPATLLANSIEQFLAEKSIADLDLRDLCLKVEQPSLQALRDTRNASKSSILRTLQPLAASCLQRICPDPYNAGMMKHDVVAEVSGPLVVACVSATSRETVHLKMAYSLFPVRLRHWTWVSNSYWSDGPPKTPTTEAADVDYPWPDATFVKSFVEASQRYTRPGSSDSLMPVLVSLKFIRSCECSSTITAYAFWMSLFLHVPANR